MIAIPIFILSWLSASVATGSVMEGFHTAAEIFLYWSIGTTVLSFVASLGSVINITLRDGPIGCLLMAALCTIGFIFWNLAGIGAAYMLTLGGVWILGGLVLWVISIIAQTIFAFLTNQIMDD